MSDSSSELQGWKEIASYLGRSMRAAQRWETHYGLPVRRTANTRPSRVPVITTPWEVAIISLAR